MDLNYKKFNKKNTNIRINLKKKPGRDTNYELIYGCKTKKEFNELRLSLQSDQIQSPVVSLQILQRPPGYDLTNSPLESYNSYILINNQYHFISKELIS